MVAESESSKFRMTPSLKKKLGAVYRPYFLALSVLGIGICIGLIVCAAILKDFDSNLKDQLFHIWVAIPILLPAVVGITVFITKSRKLVILFLICSLTVTVLCAAASLLTGIRYWLDGWYTTRERLDAGNKCSVQNNACACTGVFKMPVSLKKCSEVETAANVLVGEIVLTALGLIINIMGVYLGFMSICCGPWKFLDNYDPENDIDKRTVQFKLGRNRPSTAGNTNRGFKE
ncbi:uncharacterized protein LOC135689643 [Rhopilema esculentum]|uniref:uncharacterized protein LOC135689643 n=1 Tax=Rhopilema esculentum TaxID=499914 RepID=UPI0031DBAC4B